MIFILFISSRVYFSSVEDKNKRRKKKKRSIFELGFMKYYLKRFFGYPNNQKELDYDKNRNTVRDT